MSDSLLLPMIKAVNNMLESSQKEPHVKCAMDILSRIIEHLEKADLPIAKDIQRSYLDDELDDEARQAMEELA